MRHVFWFSCGAASAVATKIGLAMLPPSADVVIARIAIDDEHPDSDRFADECAAWFGREIMTLRSAEYANVSDVIVRTRYIAGPYGARCTTELKKRVREDFQAPGDVQYFGFTADERARADRFASHNLEVNAVYPLIGANLTKADCFAMIAKVGIELPEMYRLGFKNNNCIGCVKAGSVAYWRRIWEYFPDVYQLRAYQERLIGATINRDKDGNRVYLDDLATRMLTIPLSAEMPNLSCGILCELASMDLEESQ
jgi:hypothetical protein